LVLGVAVAQIDPLSVAAQRRRARMSERARTILRAWASFDDPITMLLTIYLSAVALGITHSGTRSVSGDLLTFVLGILGNAAFAAGAFGLWYMLQKLRGRLAGTGSRPARLLDGVEVAVLLGLVAVAAYAALLLGIAVIGLFFRPAVVRSLVVATDIAFYIAAAALGAVLVQGALAAGTWLLTGVVLGVAAYGAPFLVGPVVARGLPTTDRWYLSLAQQNGITAIILALVLETDFAGSVAIIAPAIVVINLLNAACN